MRLDTLKLKNSRILAGLSQRGLAKKVSVHSSTISLLEKGAIEGNPETIKKIADALSLSMEDIYIDEQTSEVA